MVLLTLVTSLMKNSSLKTNQNRWELIIKRRMFRRMKNLSKKKKLRKSKTKIIPMISIHLMR